MTKFYIGSGFDNEQFLIATNFVKLNSDECVFDLYTDQIITSLFDGGKNIVIHEGDSSSILKTFADNYFDVIYIDASHSYENFLKDLNVATLKIKSGGFIVCNDYTVWSPGEVEHYGILRAVHELLSNSEAFSVEYIALQGQGYHDICLKRNE